MLIKHSKHLSSKGFSLVELVVVLGLMAAAGIFSGNILFQGQKGQRKVSANFDFTTKMWEVFNVLQNSNYCNSNTNLIFKEKTVGTLNRAKLSSEDTPATNTVNWIGYRVGTGATAKDIKVLEEGDVIENTLTISEITFERQMSDAPSPQVVSATANTPTPGSDTHYVNLVITANPTSGSGFPVTKTFKLNLITDGSAASPTNEVVGCMPITQGSRRWLSFSVGGLSPTRQANTTYINNTSQEIQVAVSTYSGAFFSRCSVGIRIQNTDDLDLNFVNDSIGAARCSAQATIPPGSSYEANTRMTPPAQIGENLLQSWHEFR